MISLDIYYNAVIPGNRANKVAKSNMINAFGQIKKIQTTVYCLSDKRYQSEVYQSNSVVFKVFNIPFLNEDEIFLGNANIFSKIMYHIYYWLVIKPYFLILFLIKNKSNKTLSYIRGCTYALFLATFFKSFNFVFETHNYEFGKSKVKDYIYKRIINNSLFYITISEHTKKQNIKHGISADKIKVFHSGVDIGKFTTLKKDKQTIRKKLYMPNDKHILLYTGHLYDGKGFDTLLYAIKGLKGIVLYVVGGNKSDIRKYKDIAKKENIHNIIFEGYKEHFQIPYYNKASDILIIPNSGKFDISKYHTSPIKLFEYMASNRPIIASDLPSITGIVSEKEVDFFEADDSQDLQEKIKYVLANYKKSLEKSNKACELVKKYTWNKRAYDIYKSAIAKIDN